MNDHAQPTATAPRRPIAAIAAAALIVAAIAVPSSAAGAIKKGPYGGNSTAASDEPIKFKVKKSKKKTKKGKVKRTIRVKKLEMENVVVNCTEHEYAGGPPVGTFTGTMPVPQGTPFRGKNAAKVKKDGSFKLKVSLNRHLDEGQHVDFRGELSGGGSAEGRFLITYNSYFENCTSTVRHWSASAVR